MKKIEINFLEAIHKGNGYEKNIISLRFIFFISQTSYCIDLVGSSIMIPITIKVGDLYTQAKKIPVSYHGIGSSFGIENAKKGGLGVISRDLTLQEKKRRTYCYSNCLYLVCFCYK